MYLIKIIKYKNLMFYLKEDIKMSEKFVLNETSYFGRGSRNELASEIANRGFKKVFFRLCL